MYVCIHIYIYVCMCVDIYIHTGWGPRESKLTFPFARFVVIFSLALVCILRRVFEQLVNNRAVTMLRYTRCNIVILMATSTS